LNRTISGLDYLEGKKDYIHKYYGLGESSEDLIKAKKDRNKKDSLLAKLKIERDSL